MNTKVPTVMAKATTKSGRIASASTSPDDTTISVPRMGPTMPSSPAATVSQIVMPVALSGFARQLPQMVAQLWLLIE